MIYKKVVHKFWLPIALILLICINWLASTFHNRIDVTAEQRFTLSKATKSLLKKVNEPLTFKVFLNDANLPSGFKQLAASTKDVLQEFKENSNNNIQFEFISADEQLPNNIAYADTLASSGLYPINLTSQLKNSQQQQYVYPFAVLQNQQKLISIELYIGKTPLINFTDVNSAEALLEYKLIEAIAKITQTKKPTIGYALGNGEPDLGRYNTYDLVENVLKPDYNLFTLNLNQNTFLPTEFKALIIVKPTTGFTDMQKLQLDQYVMQGGKLLLFIDRLNAEMDSLQIKNEVTAFDRDLKINDLLFNYGARINADLVMDLQCDYLPFDVNGNGQFELLPWNYFPVMTSSNSHPINKGLGFVVGRFVNSIDTVEAEGISKTVLLSSSINARTIGSPAIISGAQNVNAPENEAYNKPNISTAVLLEGKFKSMFTNRLSTAMEDSLTKNNRNFFTACGSSNKIILVADGDLVLNSVVKANPIEMGMNSYTYGTQREFPFANKAFLQNCLSYLINDNDLDEAKAKDYVVRLLDAKKVENQKTFWQIINIIVPIVIVLLIALIYQWLRKRSYTIQNG